MKWLQKLRKKSTVTTKVFNLPAGITCGDCSFKKEGSCYALKGCYNFKGVKRAHKRNFVASKKVGWIVDIVGEIARAKAVAIRPHTSGDFYSFRYIYDWFTIAQHFPDRQFYAYTKRVNWFKMLEKINQKPPNFVVIYSVGSKHDKPINPLTDRHAKVFKNVN